MFLLLTDEFYFWFCMFKKRPDVDLTALYFNILISRTRLTISSVVVVIDVSLHLDAVNIIVGEMQALWGFDVFFTPLICDSLSELEVVVKPFAKLTPLNGSVLWKPVTRQPMF